MGVGAGVGVGSGAAVGSGVGSGVAVGSGSALGSGVAVASGVAVGSGAALGSAAWDCSGAGLGVWEGSGSAPPAHPASRDRARAHAIRQESICFFIIGHSSVNQRTFKSKGAPWSASAPRRSGKGKE